MANCLQFALANSVEGRDAEFNAWYDGHLPYVVTVPNYSAGQRFRRTDGPWPAGRHTYLTIWELDDPAVTLPEMVRRREIGESHHSEDIDPQTVQPPTMWRRAMARSSRFDVTTDRRAAVVLAFFNADEGHDDNFVRSVCGEHLSALAEGPGVYSVEFLTLAEQQVRNRARKFRHALLIEIDDEGAALPAFAGRLEALPHIADGQWSADLFRAAGPRVTTHCALQRQ